MCGDRGALSGAWAALQHSVYLYGVYDHPALGWLEQGIGLGYLYMEKKINSFIGRYHVT